MWLLAMLACASAPVPPHAEGLDTVRDVLLARDFEGLSTVATPFRVPSADHAAWGAVNEAASALAVSKVPSKATAAYGALVVACAGCHHAKASPPLEPGHGEVFRALEQGVIRRDVDLRTAAAARVPRHADLGASRRRLDELSLSIANPTQRASQARHIAAAMQECLRCHGLRPGL